MALKMYLKRKSAYYPIGREGQNEELIVTGAGIKLKMQTPKLSRIIIEEEVAHWHDAWYIHNWFVRKFNDELYFEQDYDFLYDTMQELRNTIMKIFNRNNLAEKLLPTDEIDENGVMMFDSSYFATLERTIRIIDKLETNYKENRVHFLYYSYYAELK